MGELDSQSGQPLVEPLTPRELDILSHLAERRPLVANSQWFEDVIGQHIAAAAANLSPDTIRQARERGQILDLHG
jgi:hypothetical protein